LIKSTVIINSSYLCTHKHVWPGCMHLYFTQSTTLSWAIIRDCVCFMI